MSFTRRDSVRWFDIPNLRLTEMDSTGFSGGGGGGATDLDGLSDVTISAASSGQVLKHDGVANEAIDPAVLSQQEQLLLDAIERGGLGSSVEEQVVQSGSHVA